MNEKKLGAIIVLIVASIAPAMILGGYVANALTPPNFGPMMEALALGDGQINETPTSLNMSISISGCADEATPIDTVKLSDIFKSDSPGVAVSVNGTYVNCAASPLFVIQPNDTAVVNMIVPYTSYPFALSTLHNRGVVSIMVLTGQTTYYVECDCS